MNFSGSYKDLIQPDKVHALSLSVLVDEMRHSSGGTGANIAYNLALLGDAPVLLGSMGNDAEAYFQKLKQAGVDTSRVHKSPLPTATFSVLTDMDNNQVGGFYPGAMSDADTLSFLPWKGKAILAVISAHDPAAMRRQVKECQTHDIPYCYDVSQQVSNISAQELREGLQGTEILFANDYELAVMSKKMELSEKELEASVPICVTTLGENGCRITGKKVPKELSVPAVPNVAVVDPTGAGDAFRAGFFFGFVREWPLTDCARLGAVVASFAIEQAGTQEHIFTWKQCSQRFEETYQQPLP